MADTVEVSENEIDLKVREALKGTINSYQARGYVATIGHIWLSPPRFNDEREVRASIYLNNVRTQWRWSARKNRWVRAS